MFFYVLVLVLLIRDRKFLDLELARLDFGFDVIIVFVLCHLSAIIP